MKKIGIKDTNTCYDGIVTFSKDVVITIDYIGKEVEDGRTNE